MIESVENVGSSIPYFFYAFPSPLCNTVQFYWGVKMEECNLGMGFRVSYFNYKREKIELSGKLAAK